MASKSGPDIIEDGLVLCLDAASKRSYIGNGTSWKNLADSENGALINGPTFSSDNVGKFYFDGSNDYCEFAENEKYNFQPSQPFSVFCWMIKSGSGGAILGNMQNSSPYRGWDLWNQDASHIAMHLITSWSSNAIKLEVDYTANSNRIIYFGFIYDGSCPTNNTDILNSVNFYIDGELHTTGKQTTIANGFDSASETIPYPAGQKFRIGSRYGGNNGASSLFAVHIYSKTLTADEVRQNYLSTKERFA